MTDQGWPCALYGSFRREFTTLHYNAWPPPTQPSSSTKNWKQHWVKIIQIWQSGGQLFSNVAGCCHILFLTNVLPNVLIKNENPNICDTGGSRVKTMTLKPGTSSTSVPSGSSKKIQRFEGERIVYSLQIQHISIQSKCQWKWSFVCDRCLVLQLMQFGRCLFYQQKYFRHLKVVIALAILVLNEWEIVSNNSAGQGLMISNNVYLMISINLFG